MLKAKLAKKVIITVAAAGMLFISAASVSAASAKLTSSVSNNTIAVGQSEVITANGASVKWLAATGDLSAAKISTSGNKTTVKGIEDGTVTVKAIVDGTVVKQNVTIKEEIALSYITTSKMATTLNVGKSENLAVAYTPATTTEDKDADWTTSNAKVATVKDGVIKAVAPGTAKITAKVGTKTATCDVTVKAPLQKIELNKTSASLKTEKTLQLSVAAFTPENTTDSKTVKWSSSNSSLATVSSKGKVTAIKAGTVKITAKVGTKTATCTIKITASAGKYVNTNDCYKQLNSYRKAKGLKALSKNATLEKHAKTRAKELVKKFSHTRPNGQKGLSIIKGNLYKGENIAKGQTTCAQVSKAWYNSTGHRANMLHKKYTKVGIAGFYYNGQYYWVQLFSN